MREQIKKILELIGENPDRIGLKDTPGRVEKMFGEIFKGYNENKKPKITVFDNDQDGICYDSMIIDKGYFFSMCEHHMVPFFGKYYFAYIPGCKIVGLSKIARIVDFHSSKLQIQERLTKDVVDEVEKAIQPKGIALILKARHLCKEMRGVKKINGEMVTSDLRGLFREKEARMEFMELIKNE